jgi:general secretion pathway protein A
VVRAIHKRAQGIPRQINLLCDRALLGAYGRKLDRVNRRHVAAAAEEVFGRAHASVNRSSVRPWLWIVGGVCFGGLLLLFALGFRAAPLPLPTTSVADDLGPATSVTAAELGAGAGEDVSTGRGAQVAGWLINENLALEQLWRLNSDAPFPAGVCAGPESEAEVDGLRCLKGTAQVWDPVIALNRPVVLDMQTPGRFSAATLVVAFEGAVAWVLSDKGVERVRLVDMARAWRGHYRMFWQPPQGWGRPLVEGDVDPVITVVAQLFATLDQQVTPLTEQRFTPALAERVRLFQAQKNLIADGVVGVQTLLKLNDALGTGLAPDVALRRAQWLTEGP